MFGFGAALLAVAACSGPPGAPAGTPAASASASASPSVASPAASAAVRPSAILTVERRGGECPAGACSWIVQIDPDGQVRQLVPATRPFGVLPQPVLEALVIEIERANFPLIESRPFTGECPTAYDGQETVYTFHLATGDETIASCAVAIDPNHPLFLAVAAALAESGAR